MFEEATVVYETERATPAWKLFNWHFQVTIPNYYVRSIEDMEEQGLYTSGYDDLDESLAQQSTTTSRTVAQLAELFDNGCEPIICNPEQDGPKIYKLIMDHIKDWAEYFNRSGIDFISVNHDDRDARVVADLQKLEAYLKYVHGDVLAHLPQRYAPGSLMERFMKINGPMSTPKSITNHWDTIDNPPKQDLAVVDIFSDMVTTPSSASRVKKWRV